MSSHFTASHSPEDEVGAPLPAGAAADNWELAEELAARASIDRKAESWRDFKRLLEPLRNHRPVTWHHSQRVAAYALEMAAMEEWSDQRLVVYGGLAHDLGKLAIPEEISESMRGFIKEEREAKLAVVRPHASEGFHRVLQAGFPFTAAVAGRHHLYQAMPYGVRLNEIPFPLMSDDKSYLEGVTRLVALADHFDAMTTRAAMTKAERRTALVEDFPLPRDADRIDWLEASWLAQASAARD